MNRLKEYRKEKGYTLSEMSDLIGISTGYLCHLERETRKNPSYHIRKNISKILGKSTTEIFGI